MRPDTRVTILRSRVFAVYRFGRQEFGVVCRPQILGEPMNDVRARPADTTAVISTLAGETAQKREAFQNPARAPSETSNIVSA